MTQLLRALWKDDQAAIISVEWILIVSVLIFGLIPGLVALRNTIDATMATIGNILLSVLPSFTFSGFELGAGGVILVSVGGFSFSPGTPNLLTSTAIAPVVLTGQQVDPCP